jgi:Na+-transporting methylmalonyl-CoA/oxaloacetate decarboxylase beta subunit
MKELYVHLFHILIVGTLFLYVGIKSTNTPTFMYPILLTLGIIIVFYHLYKTYLKVSAGKNPWVNLFHIFIVGPLLIYIGYNKQTTPRYAFEFLLMLGFASIGYHGYYAITGHN